ncbi:Serine acetyltransferase [Peribacillus frigoritolerans]|uniref:serine O-acetyltransferase n=1 Tax=Peribacillus frigoritolerans TaxID=450367 RepID=UPI0030D16BFF
MSIIEFKRLLKEDFYCYCESYSVINLIKIYFKVPGFKFCLWYRLCNYLGKKKSLYPIYILAFGFFKNISYKFGMDISIHAQIGGGLRIWHFSGIIINSKAKIGRNFSIRPGVVIGNNKGGAPNIGNNVKVGAGAIIIGSIKIGNNVEIGANATVVKDVPDNAVVIGNAASVYRIKEKCWENDND